MKPSSLHSCEDSADYWDIYKTQAWQQNRTSRYQETELPKATRYLGHRAKKAVPYSIVLTKCKQLSDDSQQGTEPERNAAAPHSSGQFERSAISRAESWMKQQRPILVVGGPRSGTTWIGQTVSQHPQIRYVHEPFNKDHPNEEFGVQVQYWLYDAEAGRQREEIVRAYDRLLDRSPLRRAFRDSSHPRNWKTPLRFLKHLCRHLQEPERILVKDPLAIVAADWLHETFGFQVICTIRKPVSFMASMKRAEWGFDAKELMVQPGLIDRKLPTLAEQITVACEEQGDIIDQNCLLWNVVHTCIRNYQISYPSWLYVKHEELALKPEQGFQTIFEFLGLPFTNEIREYIRRYSSARNEHQQPTTKYQPRNASATLDSWKSTLTDHEVAHVTDRTRALALGFYQTHVESVGPSDRSSASAAPRQVTPSFTCKKVSSASQMKSS